MTRIKKGYILDLKDLLQELEKPQVFSSRKKAQSYLNHLVNSKPSSIKVHYLEESSIEEIYNPDYQQYMKEVFERLKEAKKVNFAKATSIIKSELKCCQCGDNYFSKSTLRGLKIDSWFSSAPFEVGDILKYLRERSRLKNIKCLSCTIPTKKYEQLSVLSDFNNLNTRRKLNYLRNKRLGSSCFRCGESTYHKLEFHHINSWNKKMEVAKSSRNACSFDKFKEELDKCVALCTNCHARYHDDNHPYKFKMIDLLEV